MLRLLDRIIPVYCQYQTKDGLPGAKARTWHPGWFIPFWKIKVEYWLGKNKRYSHCQTVLANLNVIINDSDSTPGTRLKAIENVIRNMDCGYECHFTEPYGFVPEADCPIHDT